MKRIVMSFLIGSLWLVPDLLLAQDTLLVGDSMKIALPDSTIHYINIIVQRPENRLDSLINDQQSESFTKGPPPIGELISIGKIFWTVVVLVIGFVLIRLFTRVMEYFSEKWTHLRITIKGLIPVLRIVAWGLLIYIVVEGIINPPHATIIAFTASLGVALAFASQDILKNIFAGIVIIFDHPFSVGDKIEIGQYYGEVKEVGLRSTRIITPDDSLVAVPNAELMNNAVSNANSGEPNCQVVAEVYLPISVDTVKVRQIAIEAAQVSQYIYLDKPVVVLFFNEVKERRSYYKMRLKAYVMDIRYEFAFKSDMTEIVIRELLAHGIISADELF